MKLLEIFPKAVYAAKLGREFTAREKVLVDTDSEDLVHNIGNMISKDSYILNRPIFSSLKEELNFHLQAYFQEVYDPDSDVEIYITQSWLNYTYPGQTHHAHAHDNSFLSGVLYINADRSVDSITFLSGVRSTIRVPPKNHNRYNSMTWRVPIGSGDILIFSSDMMHQVEATPQDRCVTRVSLAFNTFLRGSIGDPNQRVHLKL